MICGIMGLMGAGKSYVAVNKWMVEYLTAEVRKDKKARHIYTNIEVYPEVLAAQITSDPDKQADIVSRIHILPDCEAEAFNADGESMGMRHQVKEFFWFVPAGAVIILDEIAEVWKAEDYRKRPELMEEVINQHRKFKWDFMFFMQRIKDIDSKLRHKLTYIWEVRNSVRTPMFPKSEMWRGVTWPVQFFMCDQFLARDLNDNTDGTLERRSRPMGHFTMWAFRGKGFKTYKSTQKTAAVSVLDAGDADDFVSSDFESFGQRMERIVKAASGPLTFYGFIVVVIGYAGFRLYGGSADKSLFTGKFTPDKNLATRQEAGGGVVDFPTTPQPSSATPPGAKQQDTEVEEPEEVLPPDKLVLWCSSIVKTTRRSFVVGEVVELDGNKYEVEQINSNSIRLGGVDIPSGRFLGAILQERR